MDNSKEHKYVPAFLPQEASKESTWALIFIDKKLLVKKIENKVKIPEINELESMITDKKNMIYIGSYDGHDCFCISIEELTDIPENMELVEIKKITALSGNAGLFTLAGAANLVLHWNSVNQFCGCCGNKMEDKKDERAKICINCGNVVYPRISPATITAIFRGDQILLAHNKGFRTGLYSLIAGYVEPGETLEQCVEREIYEEVGIKVKNIQYFSSQPWPFPDSLMTAFIAEYESGEITIDNYEITDAGWYLADNLPDIPSTDSIAGKLIRWYIDNKK